MCWQKIIKLDQVDSTNNYFSKALKENEYSEGSIISSSYQNSGKGQGDNTWESESGKNLLFSLVLYPDFLPIDNNFLLSKVISLGITNYLKTKTEKVKINGLTIFISTIKLSIHWSLSIEISQWYFKIMLYFLI